MGGFAEYESYDAVGLAALVKAGEVSATEVLEAAIARADARNPAINAVVMELYEHATEAIEAGLPEGPLTGVPFLLKDLGSALAGARTARGSRFFAELPPAMQDSVHVTRLKRAGMVIYGKTSTCELGLSLTCEPQLYGPSRNPWDLERTPAGSSGGAAAAVAARMLPIAHASDGFGSIRAPAASCGLVGLRPTRARNTMAPYFGESLGGLAIEHAVSLSVRDSAALLDATSGPAPGDPYIAPPKTRPFLDEVGADPGTLRIAFTSKAPNGAPVGADQLRVLEETATLCADLGHGLEGVDPSIDAADVVPTFRTISAIQILYLLRAHPAGRTPAPGELETVVADTAKLAEGIDGASYMAAVHTAHRIGRQMAAFHEDWDVLLTPGLGTLATGAGLARHDDGRPGGVLAPRVQLQPIHGVVQSHRPAGDDDPAWRDRERLPGRSAGSGALRRRGHTVPPRRPARRGAALDFAPACVDYILTRVFSGS